MTVLKSILHSTDFSPHYDVCAFHEHASCFSCIAVSVNGHFKFTYCMLQSTSTFSWDICWPMLYVRCPVVDAWVAGYRLRRMDKKFDW